MKTIYWFLVVIYLFLSSCSESAPFIETIYVFGGSKDQLSENTCHAERYYFSVMADDGSTIYVTYNLVISEKEYLFEDDDGSRFFSIQPVIDWYELNNLPFDLDHNMGWARINREFCIFEDITDEDKYGFSDKDGLWLQTPEDRGPIMFLE